MPKRKFLTHANHMIFYGISLSQTKALTFMKLYVALQINSCPSLVATSKDLSKQLARRAPDRNGLPAVAPKSISSSD
jgi:hypothetical protein